MLIKKEAILKVFICHKETKARRKVKLKIKALCLGALVAGFKK
jgi:hypothetical protein